MMITEIEKALKEAEAWLQNDETWENDLDGLGTDDVGMAVVARIRKSLSSAIGAELATDVERIDFLEQLANEKGGLLLHNGTETGRVGLGLRPGTCNRTLRQAIDDAMAGHD